ncbi:hypothetical protein [Streptosporangium canum]|uniref:hypothetical protein n=1 Tax=Streptosporangium canum TaxID=324952 RepID=UPI0037AA9603
MIRIPYRAKGSAAQLGAVLPGQAGPFGIRPEPAPEPAPPTAAQKVVLTVPRTAFGARKRALTTTTS